MGDCDLCSGDDGISYTCNECGGKFCSKHRLPENHVCSELQMKSEDEWFKDELSVRQNRKSSRVVRSDEESDTEEDSESELESCVYCGDQTDKACDKCGTPYCFRHKEPEAHNCALLGADTSNNPEEGGVGG